MALYKKSCGWSNGSGCFYLGYIYSEGKGTAKDSPKAVALYRKGCKLKASSACFNLALMYEHAEGMSKDKDKALALFKKACDMGNKRGCSAYRQRSRGGQIRTKRP